jgi:6-phospho-3-hexuloisomerase
MSDPVDFPAARRIIVSEIDKALAAVDPAAVEAAIDALKGSRRVFLVGVGRVALALQAFAKRLNHLGIDAWVVGSVNEPALERGDLLVAGSGSGESLVPVAIARKAKDLGARILYVGATPSSTIGRLADLVLRIPCATKLALSDGVPSEQPMTTLFEQALLLLGDAICLMIARRAGADLRSYGRHANLE